MKWLILIGVAIVVVLEYAIISVGKQADENAERMYKEWVERNDRTDGTDDI